MHRRRFTRLTTLPFRGAELRHTLLLPPTPCEVVFGFVYPVGTNANPVIQAFRDHLKQYNYKTNELRVQ